MKYRGLVIDREAKQFTTLPPEREHQKRRVYWDEVEEINAEDRVGSLRGSKSGFLSWSQGQILGGER